MAFLVREFGDLMKGTAGGLGMFSEAYYMFAIGNIKPLWRTLYPSCFNASLDGCNEVLVESLEFLEISFIMVGMITFGFIAARIGRTKGSLFTIALMSMGALFMTVAYAGLSSTGLMTFFAVALTIIAYGVGGEYPLASASAAERAEAERRAVLESGGVETNTRGKMMQLTFAMQGWGNWVNTLIILIFLTISGEGNCPSTRSNLSDTLCTPEGLEFTWRYGLGVCLPILFAILLYRMQLKDSAVWIEQQEAEKRNAEQGGDVFGWLHSVTLLVKHYWHRLLGCALTWFMWDVAFYGNKLFQGAIIASIAGKDSSMSTVLSYTLMNSSAALVGYYFAAYTIDTRWMGRLRMQIMGFTLTAILYFASAIWYEQLVNTPKLFLTLYLINSFFGQWGPNCTTWLLPSELFPTGVRSQAHGISAAAGKAGALVATLMFSFGNNGHAVSAHVIFYISAATSLLGLWFTIAFIADVTTLSLLETEKRWDAIKNGTVYSGPATQYEHLSCWEAYVLKLHQTNAFNEYKSEFENDRSSLAVTLDEGLSDARARSKDRSVNLHVTDASSLASASSKSEYQSI